MSLHGPQEPASRSLTEQPPEPKPSISSLSAKLVPVPASRLKQMWPYLSEWVDRARRENHAPVSLDAIKAKIAARDMQLWGVRVDGATVGAVVTEVYGSTCAMPYVAGRNLSEWLHLLSTVEAWAKANGCTRLEGNGRVGWERALKRQGWKVVQVTIAKELD